MLKQLPPGAYRLPDGSLVLGKMSGDELKFFISSKLQRELHTRAPTKEVRIWEEMYSQYRAFKKNKRNKGHEPLGWTVLGKWCEKQNRDWKKGRLPATHEERLHDAGFPFNDELTFDGALRAYLLNPDAHRTWAAKILRQYFRGELTVDEVGLLKDADFDLRPNHAQMQAEQQNAMEQMATRKAKPRKPRVTHDKDETNGLPSAEKPFPADLLENGAAPLPSTTPASAPAVPLPAPSIENEEASSSGSATISDQDAKVCRKAIEEYKIWLATPERRSRPYLNSSNFYERWLAQQYAKIEKWGKQGKLTPELERLYLEINPAYNMTGLRGKSDSPSQ